MAPSRSSTGGLPRDEGEVTLVFCVVFVAATYLALGAFVLVDVVDDLADHFLARAD